MLNLSRSPLFEEANPDDGGGGGGGGAAPAPYEGVFDESGNFVEGWAEKAPEGYGEFAAKVGPMPNLWELSKSYAHAQSKIGANTVVIPGEGATDEQLSEFRTALGVPAEAGGYGLDKAPEGLPEGMEWDTEFGATVQDWAHRNHVPQAALAELVEMQLGQEVVRGQGAEAAYTEQLKAWDDELRQEWGASYPTNKQNVETAIVKLGGNAADPVWQNPEVRKVLSEVGQRVLGAQTHGLDAPAGGVNPLGPREQAKALAREPDFATNPAKQAKAQELYNQDAKQRGVAV